MGKFLLLILLAANFCHFSLADQIFPAQLGEILLLILYFWNFSRTSCGMNLCFRMQSRMTRSCFHLINFCLKSVFRNIFSDYLSLLRLESFASDWLKSRLLDSGSECGWWGVLSNLLLDQLKAHCNLFCKTVVLWSCDCLDVGGINFPLFREKIKI